MGLMDEKWNYVIDIDDCEKNSKDRFESEVKIVKESIDQAIECGFVNLKIEDQNRLARNNHEDIRLLVESNRELKGEIDKKLKELTRQQTQYESYKRDQKLLQQEIKETHEAFLMGRKQYKKFLNIYYSIESRDNETQIVFVQFFTEVRKSGENYSVYLQRNTATRQYSLQSINPPLNSFKEIQRKLQETNDVPGLLCWIRQAFIALKKKKKF